MTGDTYRILVSGGRDFNDIEAVAGWLIQYEYSCAGGVETIVPQIVHGGCNMYPASGGVRYRHDPPHGADALADYVARGWGWPDPEIYWPQWDDYGPPGSRRLRRYGSMSQHAMALSSGDLCVLFPGGSGTASMGRCAQAAGIPVVTVQVTNSLRHRGRKYMHRVQD